ncbi:SYM [Enterospora canceri]|uniref:SYM n=1 Tax=Enterospora canceri TaxID=1081671 RepID=A0A1Y1S8E1_9MICR|nr:SYM [Enterospora canceri]
MVNSNTCNQVELHYSNDDERIGFAVEVLGVEMKCIRSSKTELVISGIPYTGAEFYTKLIETLGLNTTVNAFRNSITRITTKPIDCKFMKAINYYNVLRDAIENGTLKNYEYVVNENPSTRMTPEFYLLEVCAGRISEIEEVTGMDTIYREVVEFGEEKKVICSGLRKEYKMGDLLKKTFLFVTNLKAAKFGTEKSEGMICCGAEDGRIEAIGVDESKTGMRIGLEGEQEYFGGVKRSQVSMKKEKYGKVLEMYRVVEGELHFGDRRVLLGNEPVRLKSVRNGRMR